jgi:hypothetical protein
MDCKCTNYCMRSPLSSYKGHCDYVVYVRLVLAKLASPSSVRERIKKSLFQEKAKTEKVTHIRTQYFAEV